MEVEKKKWLKITIVASVFTLLVVVIAYWGMNRLINKTLESNFNETATIQSKIIEKSIVQYLGQVYNDIEMLASFPSFRGVGNGLTQYITLKERRQMKPTLGSEEEQHLYEILKIYGEAHRETLYVYLATTYGGYLCWPEVDIIPRYDPRVRPWYITAVHADGRITQTDPYVDLVTGELIISNVKSVYDDNGVFKGVLGIDVDMDEITNVVSEETISSDGQYLILHKTGLILSDTAVHENNFKYISQIYPALADKFTINGTFQTKIVNENYYGYSRPIANTNWYIVALSPKTKLMSSAEPYIRTLTLGTIGTVLIFMLIFFGGIYMLFYNRSLHRMVKVRTKDLQDMIDELIQKDINLRVSEGRIRSLIENIPGIVYRCEPVEPWRMYTISNWVETMTGYEAESFTGDPPLRYWADLIHKDDLEGVIAVETVNVGDYFEMEYRVIGKNGQERWVFERGGLKSSENGQVFMDGIIFDVSDRKRVESEIKKLYDEMETRVEERTIELKNAMSQLVEQEKMASLGGIVSGVAHEINTPLGISVTIASYLRKIHEEMAQHFINSTLSKNRLQEFINQNRESYDILETNLTRAAELVNSFKKISVNQSTEEIIKFNFSEYIQMILLSLKHEYKNKGYDIEVICDPQLEIYSYPGVFSQILTNFLINSLVHGFKNREEGSIWIKVTRSNDQKRLNLIYEDNGAGIPKQSLEKIFEPFYTTNRANGGSGLGLYIVYNLVGQKLNGSIVCKSEVGSGTSFIVNIPLTVPEYALAFEENTLKEDES